MDNDGDDYFDDDIVFDEQTLAALDQQERKYLPQKTVALQADTESPPSKRQKTELGWSSGIGSRIYPEELPEISVVAEGSYGLGARLQSVASPSRKLPQQPPHTTIKSPLLRHEIHPISNSHAIPSSSPLPPVESIEGQSPQSQRGLPLHRPIPSSRQHQSRPQHVLRPPQSQVGSKSTSIRRPNDVAVSSTNESLQSLQKKLEELEAENMKMQEDLRAAIDAKLARDGEVSVLRKNIEKTSQNHATHLAKLKAEKADADARQLEMQKEMKEEMERLKTQFIFKQHEMETSVRKQPPTSAFSRKILRDPPSTPMAIPSQIRAWNRERPAPVPSRSSEETPMRPQRRAPAVKESPKKQRNSPEKQRKSAMLPGFQNSFVTSTPMRPPANRGVRGDDKLINDSMTYPSQIYPNSLQSQLFVPDSPSTDIHPQANTSDIGQNSVVPLHAPASPPAEALHLVDADGDVLMGGDEDLPMVIEELDLIESANWKAEISRIILSHSPRESPHLTFHSLLSLPIETSLSEVSAKLYAMSCSTVMEIMANATNPDKHDIKSISKAFFSMATVLIASDFLRPLASLLNLLSVLIYSVPELGASLLLQRNETTLLESLCNLVDLRLSPSQEHKDRLYLTCQILSMLEALSFNASADAVHQLGIVLQHPEAFLILLHPSQPSWLLEHSARVLVLLATYDVLSRSFLSVPQADITVNQIPKNIPYIERLCSFLIDVSRQDNEFQSFKQLILVFFALVSKSSSDAHSLLVGSYALIPSSLLFLSQLVTPLWEDDENLINSPQATASLIRVVNQTLFLLHHLVLGQDPAVNLRHKIQHAPHRPFNGLNHMFIVTFGKLSCYDVSPPEWIDPRFQGELDNIADMAHELLELVVDGPEVEDLWSAYSNDQKQESIADEEELEARLLGSDDLP
ncbi:hypothetical protein BDQ12DRAFT_673593 [Crucibulum laeve]|uniref:Uncharacterized protein n=1 Tax=Crucibulum laeve TaxID=68775 RepID=A0A5C3MIT0_9AGAR|nr:hypothetical protein BDQ12DRAFT_673593 [Crucibulum laeve]